MRKNFRQVTRWLEAGESVRIIKHGKPLARIIPELNHRSFLGAAQSNIPLPDDLDDPVPVTWEACG